MASHLSPSTQAHLSPAGHGFGHAPAADRRPVKRTVTVEDGGRRFVVAFHDDRPRTIKERQLMHVGTVLECWGNRQIWHASHGWPNPGPRGLTERGATIRRVLAKAGVDTRQFIGN